MTNKDNKNPATIAARAGGFVDLSSGGVVPPLQQSTTFVRDENYDPLANGNVYGRDHSDQVRLAEKVLNKLEGADETLLFSSGMAAINALFSWLKSGQTLLLQSGIYWGTTALARRICEHRGIKLIEADSTNFSVFAQQITQVTPDLIFIETPSNPWILTSDIEAISKTAKAIGSQLAVDATAATPLLMKPLALGADIVVHSATKALNGHSDVLAGVLSCCDAGSDLWQFAMAERHDAGAILSPHSAWLLIRGMRTLPLRLERMCSTALTLAEHLAQHPKVEAVWYPGLEAHQGHELAKSQMPNGFGYLLSFLIEGGRDDALEFCRHLEGIHRATSLGGVESLIEHRHTIEGDMTGCPGNLIRLSVGIEDIADLTAEIDAALDKI